jgi:Inner membrane component of T3SS, cytoplasmic domain
MNWSLLCGFVVFALLLLAAIPAARCRRVVLGLLHHGLRLVLGTTVVACAVFHFCPELVPPQLAGLMADVLNRLEDNLPPLRLARLVGSPWLVLAVVAVLAGLPVLARLKHARRPEPAAVAGDAVPAPGVRPRLVVVRGLKQGMEYPLGEGSNIVGRADVKPVDIDLEDQEPPDRIWSSRQHALITLAERHLTIADLNSANGTYLNRQRLPPAQRRPLRPNDVIQIGTVWLRVTA